MLGSHNSMSYLKPIHWWQRWQRPWYRCQEINLVQQYKQGARYFDIRVNLINDCWHYVHNKIDFGYAGYFNELDSLIELAERENQKIYLRIILDRRKAPKTVDEQKNLVNKFQHLITWLQNAYKIYNVICIDEAIVYWNWKRIYKNPLHPEVYEYHNSVINKNNLLKYLLGNKHFAKKRNHEYATSINLMKFSNYCTLMDFVNIK